MLLTAVTTMLPGVVAAMQATKHVADCTCKECQQTNGNEIVIVLVVVAVLMAFSIEVMHLEAKRF